MIRTTMSVAIVLGLALAACSDQNNSRAQATAVRSSANKTSHKMKNLISIVEIPTDSFPRAVKFYQSILDVSIEEVDMQGTQMGVFPGDEGAVSLVLIKSDDYKPSKEGSLVYLNGGENLQSVLDKIEPNGGKVVVPKTEIAPEMGFFAMFIDSEGNKMGLHSYQ